MGQLGCEVHGGLRAPAEAAAGQHGLDLHLIGLEAEHAGDGLMVARLQLAAQARHRTLSIPAQEAVQRLHRRMRQIGKDVLRLDHPLLRGPSAASASPCWPATVPGLRDKLPVLFDELVAAALLGVGLVPGHAQLFAPLEGGPHAFGIDGDTGGDLFDIDHAAHRQRVAGLERHDLAAEAGRPRDDDREHVGLADIDGELRRAVGLGGAVELPDRAFAADQPEARRVLERYVLRHRQLRRGLRELAEPASAPASGVAQHAALDRDLARRHAPGLRRCLDQHGARRRAGLAHLLVGVGDGAGAARALHAEREVLVELGIGRRVLGPHLGPVRVQLFGNQRGETGERSLAELDVLAEHRHRVVGADAHERVGRECGSTGIRCENLRGPRLGLGGIQWQMQTDDETGGALEHRPARERLVLDGHGVSPPACARHL